MVSYVLQPANRQSVCLVLSKQSVCFEICTGCGWLSLQTDSFNNRRGRYGGADTKPEALYADEVILCAGAVHSPAILQRSGVAPATLLQQLGVKEQVAELPVGESFQDHPGIRLNVPLRRDVQLPHGGFRHIGD